jgi:hypothetical protein
VIVRFSIPDILVAYFSMAYDGGGRLSVEGVTAAGPREEVSFRCSVLSLKTLNSVLTKTKPHCQSNYAVYQKLSQQTAKMIQSHPTVSFQELGPS